MTAAGVHTAESGLAGAHAEVKAEIARIDTKASLLLAFIGVVLAGAATLAKDAKPSILAIVVGAAGAGVLLVAVVLLLRAVRPNLSGRPVAGFPLWATLTGDQVRNVLAEDRRGQDIANLSRIAVAKFLRLKRAVDCICVGGALLVLAALITAGGAL
ncbi:Pycsar system effector family protein [Streptomyces genisteinicus]|uniref:Integral membrane plasmid transfer protein n=1 Tax=Streptomyces genisteinicus TaxID=2768068 RepID=A0A7H0HVA0_9ACTN|nr:Pycsar system effector family protein [Streptomyces genisteinicus]QNP64466.1 integral membrane plasmid transfer protein [Streptomyces genisteinicus]